MSKWRVEEEFGYTPLTTYWDDFSIADAFGVDAIKDTYKRAFEYAKLDYKYLTELVMVLNHKIWEHYETNVRLGMLYNELWEKADAYGLDTLKDNELSYFIRTLD